MSRTTYRMNIVVASIIIILMFCGLLLWLISCSKQNIDRSAYSQYFDELHNDPGAEELRQDVLFEDIAAMNEIKGSV